MGISPTLNNSNRTRLEAKYANYFQVGHRLFEFFLEFGQMEDDADMEAEPHIHTRIVLSPARAKVLINVLCQSIDRYERDFGRIEEG